MIRFLICCFLPACLLAQQAEPLADDGARVSVLGYHVFHSKKKPTEMLISTSKFRKQMEAVKESKIPVITMSQFLKWRRGEAALPPQSILITLDDGWRSVYTEAFPVFRELQIPFTIYLYKNYVGSDKGGRALSLEMIEEMRASKLCTIGSHSVSHPFPSKVKKFARQGEGTYDFFLREELGESKNYLETKFREPVTTYAYPGGYHTPEMFALADEFGYDCLFTVKPGKVRRDSPKHILPRYIVLGNHDGAFRAALTFRNGSRLSSSNLPTELPHPVSPGSGELISTRLPEISVDLSGISGIDENSIVLRVAGFGKVPAQFNPETKKLVWQVTRPLRQPHCEVETQWKLKNGKDFETPLRWSFQVDREASYQGR